MTPIDLSHPLSEDMPVYPGTEPPEVVAGTTVAEHGFFEKKITLYSHTGTHVDAPAHLLEDGKTLDAFPVDQFFGPAMVLDATESANGIITLDRIEARLQEIEEVDFLLIRTGWDRHWGAEQYFADYPVLSIQAAEALAGSGLIGIGFDAISPDPVGSSDLPVHKVLMAAEMLIIENLTGLGHLPSGQFVFSCFPLALEDADGSPVRAVAFVE